MKKFLTILLTVVLTAAVAITGTVAYLTDTDEDVNTMTFGNVKIDQHEYERNEAGEIVDFTQDKPLYPYVGELGWKQTNDNAWREFTMNNVVDKYVTVKNTGVSDAYVRTYFAFEMGKYETLDEFYKAGVGASTNAANGAEFQFDGAWVWGEEYVVEIDGQKYNVMVATHINPVKPGEETIPSLLQVYLDKTADYEDCEALDGNGNGRYDILVLSQAVQVKGFENADVALKEAFGDPATKTYNPWEGREIEIAGIAKVDDANELKEALEESGKVVLKENIANDATEGYTVEEGTKVKVELNDKTLDSVIENYGDLEISGGTLKGAYMNNYGDATITDTKIEMGTPADYAGISRAGSETVYNNAEIVSAGGGVAAVDGAKVVFNSGSVAVNTTSTSGRYLFYAEGEGSEIVINGGDFSFSKTLNQKRAYVYAGAGTTVIINGGNFGPASTRSGYTAGILGEGEVIIKGGTFGFDPSNWVADGYEAVKTGTTWTVSAK